MFEIVQKISDDALKTCPETGQMVKRVITGGSGVVYKGSGWYVTDYKNRTGNGSAPSNGANGTAASPASGAESASGTAGVNDAASSQPNGKGSASDAGASKSS